MCVAYACVVSTKFVWFLGPICFGRMSMRERKIYVQMQKLHTLFALGCDDYRRGRRGKKNSFYVSHAEVLILCVHVRLKSMRMLVEHTDGIP